MGSKSLAMRRATIRDVARSAGVSIATVSRVLNNSALVDEETGARVRRAAQELRYVPNALGRGLSTRRTDALGLLLPDLFGEFFSEVIRGADETAQQHHYHLLVSSSHSNREEIEAALKVMRGRVDGMVIMSPHIDAQTLSANLPHSLPVALLNCHVEGEEYDSLNIDNHGGAFAMVRHLIDHGHRAIGIIQGTEKNLDAYERLCGYRDALAAHGALNDHQYEQPGDFTEASGFAAAECLLRCAPRPTAIFASNDSMAIGALSALRRAGLRVPEDIALAGFDDIPVCAYLTPALTSVRVDVARLGILAVETLIHAVQRKMSEQVRQVLLPTTLSIRKSCGCPG
jgi:LacI family transcriptional regulator